MQHVTLYDSPTTSQAIPVTKIFAIGLNYSAHAKEMHSTRPEEPVVFLKPPSALIYSGQTVILPSISKDVHHETEVVVLIGKAGKQIPLGEALNHVAGYGIGLDMTLRDIQAAAKANGRPWTLAKGFDTSAPVSDFWIPSQLPPLPELTFQLTCNGILRQQGRVSEMLFSIPELIAYLSRFFTLEWGDLIFTGTPEGVQAVQPGDQLQAQLAPQVVLSVNVAAESSDSSLERLASEL